MKIILLGLPGAGKGVQGKRLAGLLGVSHVSVGDIVRDLVANDSPSARGIRETFGHEVWSPLPDQLATQVVRQVTAGLHGFVLDGFPRNIRQAQGLEFLGSLDIALFLNASEEVCRTRVLARGRDGDSAEKFEARLAAERERLPELLKHLRLQLPLIEVDADRDTEAVFTSILTLLGG